MKMITNNYQYCTLSLSNLNFLFALLILTILLDSTYSSNRSIWSCKLSLFFFFIVRSMFLTLFTSYSYFILSFFLTNWSGRKNWGFSYLFISYFISAYFCNFPGWWVERVCKVENDFELGFFFPVYSTKVLWTILLLLRLRGANC